MGKGYSVTEDRGEGDRKLMLTVLVSLMRQSGSLFRAFKKDCKHNNGGECVHPLYHRDFELVNICKVEDCPIVDNYK